MAYPKEVLNQIRDKSSIADLAIELTDLKPSGANLVGLSPFQTEKTPSFYVYDSAKKFKCFSSGKSGSVFDFVMETRGFSFPEAVEFLADRSGIEIKKGNFKNDNSKEILKVLEKANLLFQKQLNTSKLAKSYHESRGFNSSIVKKYSLGYAPDSWDFILKSLDSNMLKLSGLVKSKDGKRFYDVFRNRLIFPIKSKQGHVIAFGGRALSKEEKGPKYLNSPESPVYEKRKVLYGLFEGLESIRLKKSVYIVEGYFDVMAMAKKGFTNTVASCGTAFAKEHASQLTKLASKVIVVFDSDQAGRKAAGRSFESFLNSGLESFGVLLPEGEDPDTFCAKNSYSKVETYINDNVKLLFDFFVLSIAEEITVKDDKDQKLRFEDIAHLSPSNKGELSKRVLKVLTKIINSVEREAYINRFSEIAKVKLSSAREVYSKEHQYSSQYNRYSNRHSSGYDSSENSPYNQKAANKVDNTESNNKLSKTLEIYIKQLLSSVLSEPSIISTVISTDSFFNPAIISENVASNVKNLLNELSEKDFCGLSIEDKNTTRMQHSIAVATLEKYGFSPKEYINESYRQLDLGGIDYESFASEVKQVGSRLSLKSEIEKIREQEVNSQDVEKLAQQKLLKKREALKRSR